MNSKDKTEPEKKPGLVKSFIDYFYGNFIVLLLGVVSLPLITRVLSTDEFGRTNIFLSAVSIIYIMAILGLDQSYIRYYYREGTDRRRLLLQCVRLPFLLILILAAVYFLFSTPLNALLFERDGMDITLLVMLYTVTSVFERFLFLNIRMEQNGKLYSNLNILSKVLYIGLIFIFAFFLGDDFRVGLYALTLPLFFVTAGLLIRFLRQGRQDPDKPPHDITDRELLAYGIPFVPMLLMEWLLSSMDKWSIRLFNDFSETGIYSAAMQIMSIILTFKITFVAFWSPVAMEKYENEPEERCHAFFRDTFDKVQFLCFFAAFGITLFRGIIVLLLGEGYRDAVRIIPFLTMMPILSILFEMIGQGIKFTGKTIYFNYASLAAILCNLTGNTLLVPRFRGIGAALATALTYVVYFFIGARLAGKCYPVQYDYKKCCISLILYGIYAAYASLAPDTGTISLAISITAGILGLSLHLFINRQTLKGLLQYAGQLFTKLRRKKER
ncbi:MAG: oligosaccharide flippase family protein [Lachnospiraceae bacterium]|nr:oligosaccharide flippase family protein [Lachnospiraceae bacterium]